jgi:hypothetical protein
MGKMLGDMGAAVSGALVIIGDRLGLYRALAETGPTTSDGLAKAAGVAERYVREWLSAQAASDYVSYDRAAKLFYLSPEQALVFANEDSPAFLAGGFELLAAVYRDEPKITGRFGPARASAGMSTTPASSAAPSASSGRATTPIWCPAGFLRWTAWRPSCRPAPGLRTSAAGTAPRPS